MEQALIIIKNLNLHHDVLKHLSERIEELSRVESNAFWIAKLREWFRLEGDFEIFKFIYSTEACEQNFRYIIFRLNDDDKLTIYYDENHRPVELFLNDEVYGWRYDYKVDTIFHDGRVATLEAIVKPMYHQAEIIQSMREAIQDVKALGDAIFK
jgi:hypothetical protein